MKKHKNLSFQVAGIKPAKSDHGGSIPLAKKRQRPLGVRSTMHLVLRSSKARKQWSFKRFENEIEQILKKFARKNHVHLLSVANVGNHIHLHLQVRRRDLFRAFIRAVTSAIRIKVTGYHKWNPSPEGFQFWDERPFSRIVSSWKEFLIVKNYIEINQWEGLGYSKNLSRTLHWMGKSALTNSS